MSTDPGGGQAHPPGRQAPLRVSCRPWLATLTRTHDFWDKTFREEVEFILFHGDAPFCFPFWPLGGQAST